MMQSLTEEFAAFEGDGTLFGAINKDGFHGIKMVVPSSEVLSAFSRIVAPMDARIEVTDQQIQSLSALRETLLPQLLSGELTVGQAEEMIP
jgi:type I restriction enzyme S subunit